MLNIKSLVNVIALLFVVSACSSVDTMQERPEWIDNPESNFVGKCGTHVNGRLAQEQCAYQKGLTGMAMSKGVTVDVNAAMSMSQSSTQSTGRSHGQMDASVKMDAKDIKISGTIIDKWLDRTRDVMYVLIKEN